MIEEELKEIINSLKAIDDDTSSIEIKSGKGGFPKRIWETISAFANTPGGGIIILGISQTPGGIQVTGIDNPSKYQRDLASVCAQMVPPINPLIEIHKFDEKFIITAEIPEISFKDKPCYYKGSGVISGSFIRIADGDRQLTQYEVQGFLDGRGQPLYDIEPVPGSEIDDLDNESIKSFVARVKEGLPKVEDWDERKILRTFRILTEYENKEVLTLAGLLCFGKYPQKFFPGLTIHIIVYPSKEITSTGDFGERLVDNIKVEGSIPVMFLEAIKSIKKNLKIKTIVKGLFREDLLEYPEVFLREVLINAIGHRDYSYLARGTAIQVRIFPDRMEVSNPGGLFGPITEERLGEQGLQATRNTYLMKILEDLQVPNEKGVLCENRGTGIIAMVNALTKIGMGPPLFRDYRNSFNVTCFNNTLFNKQTLSWLENFSYLILTDRQRYALAYLFNNKRMNNFEYCRMNDCDSRMANSELNELFEKELVEKNSTGRWRYYTLNKEIKNIHETNKIKKIRSKGDEILEFLSSEGESGVEEISRSLKINKRTTRFWIKRLIDEAKIVSNTQLSKSPKIKYKIKN
ncbi:MAG: ATP-binding protein [Candidatus Humimicrobiaceae bacterium]